MTARNTPSGVRHQRGAALIAGLLILVLIILLGVTALSSTVLQERMTGNQRNESLAFAGAESTLRAAEARVYQEYALNPNIPLNGEFKPEPIDATGQVGAFRASRVWTAPAGARAYSTINYPGIPAAAGSSKLDRAPLYIIEDIGETTIDAEFGNGEEAASYPQTFRITARSTGGDGRVIRTTESLYSVAKK